MEVFLKWLNRLLVFDVFLVIFGFVSFVIAVVGNSLGFSVGFELWYQLWQPLFNPAIAILILGALVSWGVKKISNHFQKSA